ncbi:MAG: glycoside hydrolase family 3 protein [Bacillota bacterium]
MALADHAAELFLIGYAGAEPTPLVTSLIRDQGLAGVILFARNLSSAEQVRASLRHLRSLSPGLPPLIAVDQEGGVVSRIGGTSSQLTGTPWPGAMTLGAAGSTDLARQVARGVGLELRALGIDMNLAPVMDVNNNPANPVIGVRSFGETPDLVAALGEATITGLREAGVIATAKHFPGHGDTAVNSLSRLASVPHDRARLDSVELVPFRRAIAAGVDAIMATHVAFPAVEPDPMLPATLSRAVLTGLLREELGFQGVILTDCLEVPSIVETFGTAKAAVAAIAAGADLVLVSHTPERQLGAIEAVREAIATGRIPPERAAEALERVRALRRRLSETGPDPELAVVGCEAHQGLAREAAARGVTVLGELDRLRPVDPSRTVLIAVDPNPLIGVEEREPTGSPVLQAMGELAPTMRRMGIRRHPLTAEALRAIEYSAGCDLVLVATYCAHLFPAQADLIRLLIRSGRRVAVIAQRGPYDLTVTPGVVGAVIMYEDRMLPARASVRYLLGQADAPGRLPATVAIPPLRP